MEGFSNWDREEPFEPFTVMLFKGLQVVAFLDPGPGAPAGDKGARERGVEEVDRHGVIQHPALS